jgi:hypothetical protein
VDRIIWAVKKIVLNCFNFAACTQWIFYEIRISGPAREGGVT